MAGKERRPAQLSAGSPFASLKVCRSGFAARGDFASAFTRLVGQHGAALGFSLGGQGHFSRDATNRLIRSGRIEQQSQTAAETETSKNADQSDSIRKDDVRYFVVRVWDVPRRGR